MSTGTRALIRASKTGVPAGTLSVTTFTTPGGTYNLTTASSPAYADWYARGQDGTGVGINSISRKTGVNLIVDNGVFGAGAFGSPTYGSLQDFSATQADSSGFSNAYVAAMSRAVSLALVIANTGAQGGWSLTFPGVTNFARKVRIWVGTFSPGYVLNAVLSDGSDTVADFACASNGNNFVEYTFQPGTPGATLTISLQKATAGTVLTGSNDSCIQMVTLQTS